MSDRVTRPTDRKPSRRGFLKLSAAAAAGGALAGSLAIGRSAHAAGSDVLKIGLIGCGGRGTGAAAQALRADPNVKLTAMGDAFADRLQASLRQPAKDARSADKVDVRRRHCFVGFDAYKQVIDSGVDVVLLATPPHFRPAHLKAAVAAGKHVFAEKPVAVDAPGVRSVLETVRGGEEEEPVGRLRACATATSRPSARRSSGSTTARSATSSPFNVNYNTGTAVDASPASPSWSDMEWQLRNWLYFTWLSGDHNVEQHVHSLDKAAWVMGDEPPVQGDWGWAAGRCAPSRNIGNIFDHHAVVYEYASGVKLFAYCRQQAGCQRRRLGPHAWAPRGTAELMKHTIEERRPTGAIGARRPTCTRQSTTSCSPASAPASRSTTAST